MVTKSNESTARGGPALTDPRLTADTSSGEIPEDAPVGVDLQAEITGQEARGFIATILALIQQTFQPKPSPKGIELAGELEEIEHLPPVSAQVLAQAIARFVTATPGRLTVAPSDGFAVGDVVVGDQAVRLVGYQAQRLRIILANRDAAQSVHLAPSREQALATFGFELAPNESITIDTRAEVWAVVDTTGQTAEVEYLAEFEEGA